MINFKNIIKNKNFNDVFTLASFSIVSQLLLVLIQPITTRLFGQTEIGNYEIFYSIFAIFAVIISLKYDIVIVSSKEESDIPKIFQVGLVVTLFFSLILFSISSIYFYFSIKLNAVNSIGLVLLPIWIFLFGTNNLLISISNRKKMFQLIALSTFIKTIVFAILQVILGVLLKSFIVVIISNIVSELISIVYYTVKLRNFKDLIRMNSSSELIRIASLYRRQPIFSTPAALLNTLSFSLIVLLIQKLFSDLSFLAYYSISLRIINLPASFIGNNIGKIYFSSASESWHRNGKFRDVFMNTFNSLLIISIVSYVLLIIIPTSTYEYIFGKGWGNVGLIIKLLIPFGVMRTIYSPISITLTILNKQIYEIFIQAIIIANVFIIYYFSKYYSFSFEQFIFLISVSLSVIYMSWIIVFYNFSKGKG